LENIGEMMKNKITSSCVLIPNLLNDGTILMVSRKNDKNSFGLPGGKVEPNESSVDAAIRECYEETGIVIKSENLFLIFVDNVDEHCCATYFCAKYDDSNMTPEPNGGLVKWDNFEVLFEGKFADYNKKLFEIVKFFC
jgi:8-oxo-dGTP pyrophosphatase MutT (NUDIX family)